MACLVVSSSQSLLQRHGKQHQDWAVALSLSPLLPDLPPWTASIRRTLRRRGNRRVMVWAAKSAAERDPERFAIAALGKLMRRVMTHHDQFEILVKPRRLGQRPAGICWHAETNLLPNRPNPFSVMSEMVPCGLFSELFPDANPLYREHIRWSKKTDHGKSYLDEISMRDLTGVACLRIGGGSPGPAIQPLPDDLASKSM